MSKIKSLKIKLAIVYILCFLSIGIALIYHFNLFQPNQELNLSTNKERHANYTLQDLPALDMFEPEIKHYYNELERKFIEDGANSSKELALRVYENLESNIYNLLTGTEFNLFEDISSVVTKYFDVDGALNNEIQNAIDAFSMDYPAISNLFDWNTPATCTPTQYVISGDLPTSTTLTSYEKVIEGVNKMTEIAKSFNFAPGTSDYEKVLMAHDFIANTTNYETSAELNQTAYSALILNNTVCAGYAKSFKYLMDAWDIECVLITGVGGAIANPESHMWNYVKLNNDWYCIDLTWDDNSNPLNYNYFLIGEGPFNNNGTNIHTPYTRFEYVGGQKSEMTYNLPNPVDTTFVYPEPPQSTKTYSANIASSLTGMTSSDFIVETVSPVRRGNWITVKFTLLNNTDFYLFETNSVTTDGSKPIFVSKEFNGSHKPVYTYKIIIKDANCNITLNFDTYEHTITLTPINAGDGTATIDKTKAKLGDLVTLNINLINENRSIKDIIINDGSGNRINYTKVSDTEYTFNMSASNVTVQILIDAIYTISPGTVNGGTGSLHFVKPKAFAGDVIIVEVRNVQEGLRATSLSSEQVTEFTSLGKKSNKFTFVMPECDVVISANLTPIPPTVITNDIKINMTQGEGKISYSVESLEVGEDVIITITPNFGKKVKAISCGDIVFETIEENKSYKFTVPSEAKDFEINIEFEDRFGFDIMYAVYGVAGFVGLIFIIFLFSSFPKKEKEKKY